MSLTSKVAPAMALLAAGFAALPSACLLLTVDWHVAAVSEAYLAVSFTSREELVGRSLFEVFAGAPGTPEADTMAHLCASLEQVLATGQPQSLPVQAYRLPDPATGELATHYWQPLNSPVRDADGTLIGVLHTVVDVTGQNRHQNQLHESQAREQAALAQVERQRNELQRVFEQAPIAIAVYRGPNYTIELANATVARLWGRTQEQLLGKGLFEALPEVAGLGYEELLDGVMATGKPHVARAMEAQHDRDGRRETVYWDFVYEPLYAPDGRIDGAMVVATEVTAQVLARRQLEQLNEELETRVRVRTAQLAEQQELLRYVLSNVPAAIATINGPDHRFSFANARYQYLVGNRATIGKPVAQALPELAEQGFLELLDRVYQTGEPYFGRETVILLEQSPTPHQDHYDLTYLPIFNDQAQTEGIMVFAVDVTEQVHSRRQNAKLQAQLLATAQRQAQERQDLYQVFEQTPVAIVLLREPSHTIDYYNPAFVATFPPAGHAPGALRGRNLVEVYPHLRKVGLITLLDQVYETGEPRAVPEMALAELYPGSTRYVTFAFQAYREQGAIVGVAAFIYEVTEQVLARQQVLDLNQELHTTNAQLTRTNADLDAFVYTASHDLRSPIANIEGLLEALRQELPAAQVQNAPVSHLLGLIDKSIARFQTTIGHLTNIIALQQAGHPVHFEEIDLDTLVSDVCLDLAPAIEQAQARVQVAVADCPRLHLSPKDVRSILFNLLSNALKYRDPKRTPVVLVQAACVDHWLELQVQDNGLGLHPDQQAQLFGLFTRLHTHVEGSGVGLYSIKKLVDNAGGSIAVESEAGVGSTFMVRLPLAAGG